MKKIENHFERKTTYIIGELIVNGCQSFKIDELDKVCKNYKVSDKKKQEVIDLYNSNDPNEDWDSLVGDEDRDVREAVANQGFGLDKLINDEHWIVRLAVANQGFGLETFINDEDWLVRAAVASQGFGLDKLINDKNWHVRKVAENYKLKSND